MRKKGERHGDTKSGGYRTTEYIPWVAMIQRCTNPNCSGYAYYGGRGIQVCDRWKTSYSAFLEDMGRRPSPLHSIDRANNNGNYEPGNVRWATRDDQARNKRSNNNITAFGKARCITDWAEDLSIQPSAISTRLANGWTPEDAVSVSSTREDDKAWNLTIDGRTMSANAWAKEAGILAGNVYHRLRQGFSHKDSVFIPVGAVKAGRKSTTFYTIGGETLSLSEWAIRTGNKRTAIEARIKLGWVLEDAVMTPKGIRTTSGSSNGNSKLTENQVSKIKEKSSNGSSDRQLGLEFGVSKTTIAYIRRRATWKNV
jgi:hypothetical protein